MKAIVNISLKQDVLDPQGKAVHHALDTLKFKNIIDVRIGKQIILELKSASKEEAKEEVMKMCQDFLANTVIENYRVEIQI